MKIHVLLITFLAGVTLLLGKAPALAQSSFPLASEVLAEAKQGRIEFLRAVGRLEETAEFAPERDLAFSYLRLIPPLTNLADVYGFDAYGGSALYRVKFALARAVVKWINITDDSMDDLVLFINVAEDETLWQFLDSQGYLIGKLRENPQAFERAYNRFAKLAFAVANSENVALGVKTSFRDMQAEYLNQLLRMRKFSMGEVRSLYLEMKTVAGIEAISKYLWQAAATETNGPQLTEMLDFAFVIITDLKKADFFVPSYLRDLPQRAVVSLVDKMVVNRAAISAQYVERIFSDLEVRQIEDLLYSIQRTPFEMVDPSQTAFVASLARQGLDFLENYGLIRQAEEMKDYYGRIRLMEILTPSIEGEYPITLDGVSYRMSVLRDGLAEVAVGIGSEVIDYSMVHSFYDIASGDIVVSRFYKDAIGGRPNEDYNYTIRIHGFDGNTLRATFDNGRKLYKVNAKKSRSYQDYLSARASRTIPVEGVYEGSAPGYRHISLNLRKTGRVITATLVLEPQGGGTLALSFINGMLLEINNIVYIKSGETPRGNFVQIRGQVRGQTFHGQYIAAGTDKVISLSLNRIN